MILPYRAARIPGRTRFATRKAPVRLTASVRSHSSLVVSSNGSTGRIPALSTAIETGPHRRSTSDTAPSTAASSVTSQTIPSMPSS
jgi:hypothetical protein